MYHISALFSGRQEIKLKNTTTTMKMNLLQWKFKPQPNKKPWLNNCSPEEKTLFFIKKKKKKEKFLCTVVDSKKKLMPTRRISYKEKRDLGKKRKEKKRTFFNLVFGGSFLCWNFLLCVCFMNHCTHASIWALWHSASWCRNEPFALWPA